MEESPFRMQIRIINCEFLPEILAEWVTRATLGTVECVIMHEKKLKHLEFIQNIITRMNANSFVIKGWSVTLVSALFALAADKANLNFVFIAYVPILMFWALDGFFLSQEKQYRKLYEEVASKGEDEIDFNLNATKFREQAGGWLRNAFSKTRVPFHLGLMFVVMLVTCGLFVGRILKSGCLFF